MNVSRTLSLCAIAAAAALPAQAAVITFEGHENTPYSAPITRSGFIIGNVVGDEQHFHEITSNNYGLPSNGTGVLLNDRDTRIFVEAVGGIDFSLNGVDVAAALGNAPATGLTLEGFLNGVSVGSFSVNSLGNGYTSIGSLFGTIDRLVFDGFGGGGGFVLDNLDVGDPRNNVPEPFTLALVGSALLMAGAARRTAGRR